MKRQTIGDKVFAEVIIYGGIPVTRETAYRWGKRCGLPRLGFGYEWAAMMPPKVEGIKPWPWDDFVALCEHDDR